MLTTRHLILTHSYPKPKYFEPKFGQDWAFGQGIHIWGQLWADLRWKFIFWLKSVKNSNFINLTPIDLTRTRLPLVVPFGPFFCFLPIFTLFLAFFELFLARMSEFRKWFKRIVIWEVLISIIIPLLWFALDRWLIPWELRITILPAFLFSKRIYFPRRIN